MNAAMLQGFGQAVRLLLHAQGNSISEDLIMCYIDIGLLSEVDDQLMLTDAGRAALYLSRLPDHFMPAFLCMTRGAASWVEAPLTQVTSDGAFGGFDALMRVRAS